MPPDPTDTKGADRASRVEANRILKWVATTALGVILLGGAAWMTALQAMSNRVAILEANYATLSVHLLRIEEKLDRLIERK